MKERMIILFLAVLILFVLTGCGREWDKLRRYSNHQTPSITTAYGSFADKVPVS